MKRLRKVSILVLIVTLLNTPVFAAEDSSEAVKSRVITGQVTSSTGTVSTATIQPRGDVLAFANLTIINEGRGVIGIVAMTTCHVQVDRIRMRIYLDRYDEASDSWWNMDYYDFNFLAEDYPDEFFSDAIVSFDITDQQAGYYYSAQGLHYVWKDGVNQGFHTQTDGIKITSY